MKRFLRSVGRFGDSPFLFALYGSGELPQCFCRMSAVFGGLYYLNMTIDTFNVNKETNTIESIKTKHGNYDNIAKSNELEFSCKHLIMDSSYVPKEYFNEKNQSYISRCMLITNKSLFNVNEQSDAKEQQEQVGEFYPILLIILLKFL